MILLIDSYDSFTNNLVRLISIHTGKKVTTIHNDSLSSSEYENFFQNALPKFEYVIIGPGPGHPSIPGDVGIISALFQYLSRNDHWSIPILGICLGFQCLCYEFGNEIERLDDVKHGQIYDIHPVDGKTDLFAGSGGSYNFPSVRYHSLYVDIEKLNDNILPLAVCYEENNDLSSKQILMAARHKLYPFYGVQYHPESICSKDGDKLVMNFDRIAADYNKKHRLNYSKASSTEIQKVIAQFTSSHPLKDPGLIPNDVNEPKRELNLIGKRIQFAGPIDPLSICDYIHNKTQDNQFFLLNSASIPGDWSIIGIPIENQSEVITHSIDNINEIEVLKFGSMKTKVIQLIESETVWNFIGTRIGLNYIPRDKFNSKLGETFHSRDFPFLGGYMGLFSYEEGQHLVIDKFSSLCNGSTPDMKLVFIERFLLVDHLTNETFIFSINSSQDDLTWAQELKTELEMAENEGKLEVHADSVPQSVKDLCHVGDQNSISFDFPSREAYNEQFSKCQELLHSGDSYELCLTTLLRIRVPSYIQPWEIYKVLILHKNPSPFSCFMSFDDVVLISSSPERFLSWKDGSDGKKKVELRPIKGTVRNTPDVSIEDATKILKTAKEMGENLMIVDLIRHDLHEFIDHVEVTKLMTVEEYKTVYQLVSFISGSLENSKYHGIDILHKSLPPGSMTGAPKKRSVELLQDIESIQTNGNPGGRRGVYSGVAGYWSVTDDADWSVIIRSLFHYTDDKNNKPGSNIWRIGAGGAITVLSDADGEWDEMKVKLTSALQVFQ